MPEQTMPGLLGQEVEVVLSHGDEREPSVIARGKLLAWDDFGECQLLDEMGSVHHCWPMLEVRPLPYDDSRRA